VSEEEWAFCVRYLALMTEEFSNRKKYEAKPGVPAPAAPGSKKPPKAKA
jgi:hypothetical protein